MNCAAVTVTGGGAGLASFPTLFKANVGNGCIVPSGVNVDFPNPGKDVARSSANPGTKPVASWGTCEKAVAAKRDAAPCKRSSRYSSSCL